MIEGRGYFARCLQHETDHLHGHLYLDRLAQRERKAALREMAGSKDRMFARRAALATKLGKQLNSHLPAIAHIDAGQDGA